MESRYIVGFGVSAFCGTPNYITTNEDVKKVKGMLPKFHTEERKRNWRIQNRGKKD